MMDFTLRITNIFLDNLLSDYTELERSLGLHPSDKARELKILVHQRMAGILAIKRQGNGFAGEPVLRRLKLELRSARRTWTRHLVTTARLNRQRRIPKEAIFSPIAAA